MPKEIPQPNDEIKDPKSLQGEQKAHARTSTAYKKHTEWIITTPKGQAIYSTLREKVQNLHFCDQHKVFNHVFHHDCPTS